MTAIRMPTTTPYRDQAIAALEAAVEDADDLAETCVPCIRATTGWCDKHASLQARMDEIEPVIMKLWGTESDAEARAVMAGVPALVGLVEPAETGAAA